MTLDGSLPGYLLHRREAGVVDLMNKHTRKVVYRVLYGPGPKYDCVLEDALLESPLARCTAVSSQAKEKKLELFNPDTEVAGGLKQIGRLAFTWSFTYLGETYEFRQPKLSSKEFTLFLLRAPDPPVDLARFLITPSGSPWRGGAELLLQQYNIERFTDIKDPKGLEILLVLGFVGFWDAYEERSSGPRPEGSKGGALLSSSSKKPPPLPAPPPVSKSLKYDAALDGWQDFEEPPNPNEVLLSQHSIPTLAGRAFDLLKDPSMLFVVLKARTPDEIVKGVRVVEEVGRLRLRRWEELEAGSEMHQYLVEEKMTHPSPLRPAPSQVTKQPPRTINLNDVRPPQPPAPTSSLSSISIASPDSNPKRTPSVSQPWDKAPPQAMSIYLSKIVLPDLQPKVAETSASSVSGSSRPSPPPARDGVRPSRTSAGRPPPAFLSSSSSPQQPSTQPLRPPPPSTAGPSTLPRPLSSGPSSAALPVTAAGPEPAAIADSRLSRLIEGFGRLSTGRSAR